MKKFTGDMRIKECKSCGRSVAVFGDPHGQTRCYCGDFVSHSDHERAILTRKVKDGVITTWQKIETLTQVLEWIKEDQINNRPTNICLYVCSDLDVVAIPGKDQEVTAKLIPEFLDLNTCDMREYGAHNQFGSGRAMWSECDYDSRIKFIERAIELIKINEGMI